MTAVPPAAMPATTASGMTVDDSSANFLDFIALSRSSRHRVSSMMLLYGLAKAVEFRSQCQANTL
jgi:hypothetical protein